MICYEDALELVEDVVEPLGAREVEVHRAAGRVLARDIVSRRSSPPFDKAAMDGYAVRRQDVEPPPAELDVVGTSFAGEPPEARVEAGQCVQITTGAPVPDGADMVVMKEHVEHPAEDRVKVLRLTGANICPAGEDIREGETVLQAGEPVTPARAAVAASAGHAALEVYRQPSAAVVCTGSEVVEPGEPIGPGQIYNSNGALMRSLLAPWCRQVGYPGSVGDDEDELQRRLERGMEGDLLVVTGGVSVGEYDLVPDALGRLGVETLFHGWYVKPGKPLLFGRREDTLVFGLPGNPLSSCVVFYALIRPALSPMKAGPGPLGPATGVSASPLRLKRGRLRFWPCSVDERDGQMRVRRLDINGSADIAGASRADGLMVIPGDVTEMAEGERVKFLRIRP